MTASRTKRMNIFDEISEERRLQNEKWGGPEHDDHHSIGDWLFYIQKFVGRAVYPNERRKCLIRIAALSVAAIESLDRNGVIK